MPNLDLATAPSASAVGVPAGAWERIAAGLADGRAPSTRRNYAREWARFVDFCHDRGYRAVPATGAVVCDYLLCLEATVDGDGAPAFSVSRIALAAAAIRFVHRHHAADARAGELGSGGGVPVWADPLIADTLAAIRRRYARAGDRTPRPQDPIGLEALAAIVATARGSAQTWRHRIRERRDTALLLLGWVGAMRRSELVGLRVGDIRRTHEGWVITVATSKTDQTGTGMRRALPVGEHLDTCGPCAYLRWLECQTAYDTLGRAGLIRLSSRDTATPVTTHICTRPPTDMPDPVTPVFRSLTAATDLTATASGGQLVHTVVRTRLAAARPDYDITRYGAHSLRAGFVTEAFRQGHDPTTIMRQTGHTTVESLLRYARLHTVHTGNAVTGIGL